MNDIKINYLLAACGHRGINAAGHCDASDPIHPAKILRRHLEELCRADLALLTQITILQALPLRRGNVSDEYWDVDDVVKQIPCHVEYLPLTGGAFSYGLWVQACQHYGHHFDYYILIEDDYYPAHPDFVKILLNEHKKKLPNGGYLSSFVSDHAAVSNGIVDAPSFQQAIKQIQSTCDIMEYLNRAAQVNFSLMFGNNLDDYADDYRTLFNVDCIECSHDNILNKPDIFNPIQYLIRQQADLLRRSLVLKTIKR